MGVKSQNCCAPVSLPRAKSDRHHGAHNFCDKSTVLSRGLLLRHNQGRWKLRDSPSSGLGCDLRASCSTPAPSPKTQIPPSPRMLMESPIAAMPAALTALATQNPADVHFRYQRPLGLDARMPVVSRCPSGSPRRLPHAQPCYTCTPRTHSLLSNIGRPRPLG